MVMAAAAAAADAGGGTAIVPFRRRDRPAPRHRWHLAMLVHSNQGAAMRGLHPGQGR
jgi:hypothetical protein